MHVVETVYGTTSSMSSAVMPRSRLEGEVVQARTSARGGRPARTGAGRPHPPSRRGETGEPVNSFEPKSSSQVSMCGVELHEAERAVAPRQRAQNRQRDAVVAADRQRQRAPALSHGADRASMAACAFSRLTGDASTSPASTTVRRSKGRACWKWLYGRISDDCGADVASRGARRAGTTFPVERNADQRDVHARRGRCAAAAA